MADLGELLGSLMSSLVRARRMSDEQTAALAEYYRENPLLEGLSVPRIRIPELTIDMPFLIDNHVDGEHSVMNDPKEIMTQASEHVKKILEKHDIKVNKTFHKTFAAETRKRLTKINQLEAPVMKEAIVRHVQNSFLDGISQSASNLSAKEKEIITQAIREKVADVGFKKNNIAPSILANIRTADVKEQGSNTSVVRLKITLKEEGLEWAVRADESGGVERTLQPE